MTMNAMVEYLEKKGFKAEKDYTPCEKQYKFTISKNGKETSAFYKYSPYVPAHKVNTIQKQFLDDLIKQWEYSYSKEETPCETCALQGERCCVRWRDNSRCSSYEPKSNEREENTMNTNDVRSALRQSALQNLVGVLQINGARVPVRLTCHRETYGELPQIECDVLSSLDEWSAYCSEDWKQTMKTMLNSKYGRCGQYGPQIKDVIFNPPATIVFWKDNTKTVVKAEGEEYDPEKGLAMAIAKKTLGNKHNYYNTFKKWLKKAPKED